MRILFGYANGVCRDFVQNHLLDDLSKIQVMTASTLGQCIELTGDAKDIDVVALDLNMPDMKGVQGLSRMRGALPNEVPVALMGHTLDPQQMRDALRLGAAGFLPYSMTSDALLSALRLMASGEIFIPVSVAEHVQIAKPSTAKDTFLSKREREVLDGLLSGHSNKQIAERIGLSEVTIKYHLKSLRSKLGARNRTHAALRAIELGIG
ncbi:LuxR C-terminal-related transcriptional regulator [Candidatus Puniceispirillum marinum]|uniref:Two component transcriptional regulator, LuxR family n=1 Tax=Puniceispirillum marinum (strain IMCC1322) TaxID=488538 RepID=D5BMS7_PUNMI|nr:response regulator transcription factor [Candidatus Puniceispirillum marinum]ADE40120.1 two component transcriptional regulator, LuxR family [Candidatus Puniceispirillum marinum IMCC1322]